MAGGPQVAGYAVYALTHGVSLVVKAYRCESKFECELLFVWRDIGGFQSCKYIYICTLEVQDQTKNGL